MSEKVTEILQPLVGAKHLSREQMLMLLDAAFHYLTGIKYPVEDEVMYEAVEQVFADEGEVWPKSIVERWQEKGIVIGRQQALEETRPEVEEAHQKLRQARLEFENLQSEFEKTRAEAEMAQAEKAWIETEKIRIQTEKAQVELDKARLETEKARLEAGKVQPSKEQAEREKIRQEAEKYQLEKQRQTIRLILDNRFGLDDETTTNVMTRLSLVTTESELDKLTTYALATVVENTEAYMRLLPSKGEDISVLVKHDQVEAYTVDTISELDLPNHVKES